MSDWITTEEASQLSGYHVVYLRELIRAKKIAAEKKGGSWWVKLESLLEYIKIAQRLSPHSLAPSARKTVCH